MSDFRNKPLKRFGQNYLNDNNILNKIITEFNPQPNDNIIEIGPGRAALTKLLLEKVKKITAVEIDTRVIDNLKKLSKNLNLINEDFLKLNLAEFNKDKLKKIKVIGNIPYNITSPIIFKLIDNREIIDEGMFMVQKEVAKRMTGIKGTKDYGIFSIILNYFCETRKCFDVSRNVFYPKPNVDSAVVHLKFKQLTSDKEFQNTFIQVVKASFGNRRKMLKNSLSNSIFKTLDFSNCGIDLSRRAEDLNIDDFLLLTNFVITNQ